MDTPFALPAEKRTPGTKQTVRLGKGLGMVGMIKTANTAGNQTPITQSSPQTIHYNDWATPVLKLWPFWRYPLGGWGERLEKVRLGLSFHEERIPRSIPESNADLPLRSHSLEATDWHTQRHCLCTAIWSDTSSVEVRRIFGPKGDEVTGEWRRLHNKELYALYSSPNIIRVIKSRRLRWAGHVARMGERRGAYRALVGKPEGRRPLERPKRRWEDNIKMNLREVELGDKRLNRSGSG